MPHPYSGGHLKHSQRFLQAAELMLKADHYNSCISRAYYAAFHAVAVLIAETVNPRVIDRRTGRIEWSHDAIQVAFVENFCKRGFLFSRKVGQSYGQLRAARESVDYAVERLTLRRAKELFEEAKRLYNRVGEVLGHDSQDV